MISVNTLLQWMVIYAAVGFLIFTALLSFRTWKRIGPPGWPLAGRWLITFLFGAWSSRLVDLAISRVFDLDINSWRTIFEWGAINLMVTWVAARWWKGTLILTGSKVIEQTSDETIVVPEEWDEEVERRSGIERRSGWMNETS